MARGVILMCALSACTGALESSDEGSEPPGMETSDAPEAAASDRDDEVSDYAYAVTSGTCPPISSTNAAHEAAARAYVETRRFFFLTSRSYYAVGSKEALGNSASSVTTLYLTSPGVYSQKSAGCQVATADAGVRDAGAADAATPGSGPADAAIRDAGALDAATPDGGPADAAIRDARAPTPVDAAASTAVDAQVRDSAVPSVPDAAAPPPPTSGAHPSKLPSPRGACPELREGVVSVLGRQVTLWMGSDGESKFGPAVIYWHATGSSPSEVSTGLGAAAISEIKALGGMVMAMNAYDGASSGGSTTGNNVWYVGDLDVADEVLACAIQTKVGIDTARVHTLGFSAGGLQASYMLKARSNYIASAVSYSGGAAYPVGYQDASNKLPVIFFHGGSSDNFGLSFETASINMANDLKSNGHFVVMCNHGGGHRIPNEGASTSWPFFRDHPYERTPEPYNPLPISLPSYCATF